MLKLAKINNLPDRSQRFTPANPVQNRRSLATLHDAADFITALPKERPGCKFALWLPY
jgi:hypothetical protein